MKNKLFFPLVKVFILLFIGSIFSATSFGQDVTIRGSVKDAQTMEPIIGASITIEGTTRGVVSDLDGNFEIKAPGSGILNIYYLGYKNMSVNVQGRTQINILLEEDAIVLGEVVAIGYGSQKKKEITGSVASLKAKDFSPGVQSNPMGMLQGKVAGLNISKPGGGDPNGDYIYQLRGTSSLQGNTSPLIIIDGMPQGNMASIPQDEIESIDILKDGSAAAIYGTRGTNGVILITTKKGKAGTGGTQTSYSGYISTESIGNRPDNMSYREFLDHGGTDIGSKTNWIDEITRTPFIQSHNLAITGGTDKFSYRSSLLYKNNEGIAINSGYKEMMAKFSANQKLLKDKVQITYDVLYRRYEKDFINYDAFKHAMTYNPTAPVYKENGDFYEQELEGYFNPVAWIKQRDDNCKGGYFQGSARVAWNILDELKVSAFGTIQYMDENYGKYTSLNAFKQSDGGRAEREYKASDLRSIETTIDYVKSFGSHNLVALAGYSYEENIYEGFKMFNNHFDTDYYTYDNIGKGSGLINNPAQDMMSSYKNNYKLISFFGRINYNYDERYLASVSLRRDGNSRFGDGHKWGTFPAVSLGWRISGEGFMKDVSQINDLKLRVGYGVTGNQVSDSYKSLSLMDVVGRYFDKETGKWINAYGPSQNENPDLGWEKKGEYNAGIDVWAFDNRVGLTVDAYLRKVKDMLYTYLVPTPPNLYKETLANVGDMTSKGLEFTLTGVPVKTKIWNWNSVFNISFNTSKIDKFSNDKFITEYIDKAWLGDGDVAGFNSTSLVRLREGGKVGDFYLPVFVGFDKNGKWVFEDVDGDGSFNNDADRRVAGNAQPDFIFGWTNTLTYKDWDLSIFIRGVYGNEVFNVSRLAYENRTKFDGSKNMMNTAFDIPLNDTPVASDYYLEDGSYLKIDNVTIGYNIPLKSKEYVSNIRIYATGQNLYTLTDYKGISPEVDMMGLDNIGIERTKYYPTVRTYVLGVNLTF